MTDGVRQRRDLIAAIGVSATAALSGCTNVIGELRRATNGDGPFVVAPDGDDLTPGTAEAAVFR